MKYLIVNADDFGASRGTNRGIVEAHLHGIVTSTSLMVTRPWSEDAVARARTAPRLGIGLHVDLSGEGTGRPVDPADGESCRCELRRQLARFERLTGAPPTHLDAHHNVHRDARLLPHFLAVARRHRLPLREHSSARYVSSFYGQWSGETHAEQIGVEQLLAMLDSEVPDGVTELGCHPGFPDPELRSAYLAERETELRTLCDGAIRNALAERRIALVNHRDLTRLPREPSS